jgi:hypothetical protein
MGGLLYDTSLIFTYEYLPNISLQDMWKVANMSSGWAFMGKGEWL